MSLLTICQNTVDSLGFGARPSSIISNNDALARQMLTILNGALKRLVGRHHWASLIREHVITTANGTSEYAIPTDWHRYITETFWDATNYWPMRGSIDPQTWQTLQRGLVASSVRKRFRIRSDRQDFKTPVADAVVPTYGLVQVVIYPTPDSVCTLFAEYVSKYAVYGGVSTFTEAFSSDTDTCLLPERLLELDLRWRLLQAKGLDYAEAMNEAEREIERTIAQDTPAYTVNLGMDSAQGTPSFMANIPQTITGV